MGCFIFPGLEHSRRLHCIVFKSLFIPLASNLVSVLGSFIYFSWVHLIKFLMKASQAIDGSIGSLRPFGFSRFHSYIINWAY